MTKFYDNSDILEITMREPHTGEDFSRDFFEDACNRKDYDESLDAFKVEDVEYLVDYAKDYVAGTNRDFDYPEDYDPEESPLAYLDYNVNPLEKDPVILELAASLFDAGWTPEDKEEIKRIYGLPDSDAERVCQRLAYYSKH